MNANLAETFFSEREVLPTSAEELFEATADDATFTTQLKWWFHRSDLPGRSQVEMRYLFRGHSDSRWGLSSTLYRLLTQDVSTFEEPTMRDAERAMVRQLRREGLGLNLTDGQLLLVLQHHAIPTRLIDVTTSPRVALYFATADSDRSDGRLFVVAQPPDRTGDFPSTSMSETDPVPWGLRNPRGAFAAGRWRETVLAVEHDPLDPRMAAQRGRFLVGGLIRRLAGDGISVGGRNLSADELRHITTLRIMFPLRGARKHAGSKWPALGWTVRVPGTWKAELRQKLAASGITNDSLFPDIDGCRRLARFVALHAESVGPSITRDWRSSSAARSKST